LTVDGKTGLSAAINMAAFCENELGMIVLGVGSLPEPGANPTLDCAVELAGAHLVYSISLKRTGVYLAAAPLDGDGALETIVRFSDTANDWATLQRLVGALERNAIRALHPRPLEVGYGPGFDNWIIA
jgi:hypothetical protein